ncbi:MAG: hypothetical protein K2L14_04790 [Duncaniella sp.]|nr:hypothetical protein [Duncaniella sp.]
MDYHRCFEGVLQQLEISIGLPEGTVKIDIIESLKEIGIQSSLEQPFRIFTDISDDMVQFVAGEQVSVVEIGSKDIGYLREGFSYYLSGLNFHHSYVTSECPLEIFTGEDGEMDMIGHNGILKNLKGGAKIGEVEYLSLYDRADSGFIDDGLIGRARNLAKARAIGSFPYSYMIDRTTTIIVLGISTHEFFILMVTTPQAAFAMTSFARLL